ncbi:MAG: magnesium transporter CorA family protein [Actinomycetota bacterium]
MAKDIRTRVWRNGTLEAENFPFEQVSDYLEQDDCLVWADLCSPDAHRLNELADELSLDPHAVEDAVMPRERPKASRYGTHTFIAAYGLRYDHDTGDMSASQVSAFVLARGVFTVRQSEDFGMDEVVQIWDDNADLIKFGPKALVWGLLDVIVDGHFVAIEALDDAVEEIEDILFDASGRNSATVQRRSYTMRKSLVEARRAILPMREVVSTVMRRAAESHPHPEMDPYFNDLYDHVLRATEWTESLRDMITTIFETNLSLADARLNIVIKKLTSWAAIIAVPTAITGFYGQNVPYPGFGAHWGFWFSTSVIVVLCAVLWTQFRRRDWL